MKKKGIRHVLRLPVALPAGLLLVTAVLLTVSCATGNGAAGAGPFPAAEADAAESDDIIYLNLLWHQHQPMYYKEPDTGVYSRPWARVHGTKDYLDMAEMLEAYPKVKVSFNLTPVLLRQLLDLTSGAKDIYWTLAEKPAASLSGEEKIFILTRFFDANYANMIDRFPRYQELLVKRGEGTTENIRRAATSFSEQEMRDLQIWFNLAWIDPSYLAREPLASLVAKGRNFSEADKKILFDGILAILRRIIPEHRKLLEEGRIELTTTPYAHPILPLLYSTNIAKKADPGVTLPEWFSYPNDAIAQLSKSVSMYEDLFGRAPAGLWPAEGAVSQDIVKIIGDAGFSWMASGEQVLAKSLGIGGFTRGGDDTVREADELYRPYYAVDKNGRKTAVVFRDLRLSDLIGFEYSQTEAGAAADDFMARLERIRQRLRDEGASGPHLVSVILDGENAWENYPVDGKAFLNALYSRLSESGTVKTVSVTDYLAMYPEQRELDELAAGAWFSPDYGTWIGEEEENLGWDYLGKTRRMLADYDIYGRKSISAENLEKALDSMYLAEGSDWFWWYGADQDSGNDRYFDKAFRMLLSEVYTAVGEELPEYVKIPVIPDAPVPPEALPAGSLNVSIDGTAGGGEWDAAGRYTVSGGAMAHASDDLRELRYGFSEDRFSLLLVSRAGWENVPSESAVTLYFTVPRRAEVSPTGIDGELLGFRAGFALRIVPTGGDRSDGSRSGAAAVAWTVSSSGEWQAVPLEVKTAVSGKTFEAAIPLSVFPDLQTGDLLNLKVVAGESGTVRQTVPSAGPLRISVPQLGTSDVLLSVDDPAGDDHGPGSYSYPSDPVFIPGSYDITRFTVGETAQTLSFTFKLAAAIENPWGSGIGLSVQTFDVYIDTDPGAGTGARKLLEGRGAALQPDDGWEYALWIEGWNQKLLAPNAEGRPVEVQGSPKVIVNAAAGEVTIIVPRDAVSAATSPENWGFVAAVMSQDGFPAPGVRRIRDVNPQAEQWRIGGGSAAVNQTRILDIAWNGTPSQEMLLSDYVPVNDLPPDGIPADEYAQLPLLKAGE